MPETLALLLFLFPLAYSPGPGNMVFAANGARFGLRATLPATLGYHAATWIVTAGIGIGVFGLVSGAPGVMRAMQIVGAAYVLWLALSIARAGALSDAASARPMGVWGGVVLLVFNPKAYLIIALMFTQFLPAAAEDRAAAVIWIATIFTLNNLVAFTAWTLAGDSMARLFRRDRSARQLNLGFGAVLSGVAVWMLVA
jgi:threonine/homoserine/homoserine lactone efflux protein